MNIVQDIEDHFNKNKKAYNQLIDDFHSSYNIPKDKIESSLKRTLVNQVLLDSTPNKGLLKSSIIYILMLIYFLVFSIFNFKKKNKIDVDIIFDEYNEGISNVFYKVFYKTFKKNSLKIFAIKSFQNSNDVIIDGNIIDSIRLEKESSFNRDISFKILTKQFTKLWLYYKLSKKIDENIIILVMKLLRQIAISYTHSHNIKAKYLLSAGDNHYTGIMNHYYHLNGIEKIVLLQNGNRTETRPAQSYIWADFYLAWNQKTIDLLTTLKADKKIFFGSPRFNTHLHDLVEQSKNTQIEYDIFFPEQFHCKTNSIFDMDDYHKLIDNLTKFAKKYPKCRILYRVKRSTKNRECQDVIKRLYKKMEDVGINVDGDFNINSYTRLLKSKIIIYYSSSMGTEALSIGKRVLNCNYSLHDIGLGKQNELGILISQNYELFEKSLLTLLESENDKVDKYFANKLMENGFKIHDDIEKEILKIIKV